MPRICFLTLAPSKGDVSSPSASSRSRAKMRASRAASSSVYDDTGGCGAPGSGRSVWGCCCWGAALAEYQLLGALLRRVQRAAPRAALRRALADVSMLGAVNGAIVSSARRRFLCERARCCRLQQQLQGELHLFLWPPGHRFSASAGRRRQISCYSSRVS